jgi:hypothetical protein
MEDLLKQTEGTGVDVYTHSEMLPAHYYPAFKKYSHFVGNYGNSWWKQNEEFETFNGPVIFTTNCIVPPKKSNTYSARIFTTNAAGHPGKCQWCLSIPDPKQLYKTACRSVISPVCFSIMPLNIPGLILATRT